jgi:hypothetical protein
MPSTVHCQDRYANNRAEASHRHTRQHERQMRRFKSSGQAQRFLSVHSQVHNLFSLGRHLLKACHYRMFRSRAFSTWAQVACACYCTALLCVIITNKKGTAIDKLTEPDLGLHHRQGGSGAAIAERVSRGREPDLKGSDQRTSAAGRRGTSDVWRNRPSVRAQGARRSGQCGETCHDSGQARTNETLPRQWQAVFAWGFRCQSTPRILPVTALPARLKK